MLLKFTVRTLQPRLRTLPGVVIIVIIVLVTAHAAPAAALPLTLGGWLGAWIPAAATRASQGAPA